MCILHDSGMFSKMQSFYFRHDYCLLYYQDRRFNWMILSYRMTQVCFVKCSRLNIDMIILFGWYIFLSDIVMSTRYYSLQLNSIAAWQSECSFFHEKRMDIAKRMLVCHQRIGILHYFYDTVRYCKYMDDICVHMQYNYRNARKSGNRIFWDIAIFPVVVSLELILQSLVKFLIAILYHEYPPNSDRLPKKLTYHPRLSLNEPREWPCCHYTLSTRI